SELSKAINEALCGRSYVTPHITQGMMDSFIRRPGDNRNSPQLTLRQREVLQLLVEGHSMKEAARILSISPRTVAFHKYRMMELLHLKTNADLIQFAIGEDIIPIHQRH
ncbi:MAG: response regulator transcription factor, partial [Gammaproteobacteria bacterium]|nr:response regulator transcription factor [Gammaproteobacteria bacterium]